MRGQIVNEIFAPIYQSMKVIKIDLVILDLRTNTKLPAKEVSIP